MELWGKDTARRFGSDKYWSEPLSWNKEAASAMRRDRVFCASMADVFEDRRDLDPARERLWNLIAATPNLDWLLLTKRPQCVSRLVPWADNWPSNVWLGTTAENQRWADKRVPQLLEQPAVVHFLSCEPLLGPVDLFRWLPFAGRNRAIAWVIAGGESGHRARPMNPDWARTIRDQCEARDVPFHFKQWGNWRPAGSATLEEGSRVLRGSDGSPIVMVKLRKKVSGRTLDGRQWNGLPDAA